MIWAKKYIVFLCIIGFLSSCKRKILEPQNNQIEVTLLAPDSAMAGQKFYLKLKTKGVSAEASVFFIYHNNWGTSRIASQKFLGTSGSLIFTERL